MHEIIIVPLSLVSFHLHALDFTMLCVKTGIKVMCLKLFFVKIICLVIT